MKTKHHKVPRNCTPEDPNVVLIEDRDHRLWHKAWGARHPQGIVGAVEALQELFGDVKLSDLKRIIETHWS
jgi:hypothetical protein